MLKLKLTTLEGLPADIAKEYKKDGDSYVLDTDVKYEDVTGLKSALDAEKRARKEATEKNTTYEEKISDLEKRAGSATDLEKSWQDKLTKKEQEFKQKLDAKDGQLREVLVDSEAIRIANEIAVPGGAELLLPHLTKRLTMEEVDGKMLVRVLDSEGKMTALSVKEFQSEVIADKKFASILVASKASGGGANGGQRPAGGKTYKDMTEAERSELARTNRPEFDRQRGEFLKAQQQPQGV